MTKKIFFCLFLSLSSGSIMAWGSLTKTLTVSGYLVNINKKTITLSQRGVKTTLPRNLVPQNTRLALGHEISVDVKVTQFFTDTTPRKKKHKPQPRTYKKGKVNSDTKH